MWIERNIQDHIKKMKDKFPVILITGARQVGKTSILKHLFPDLPYITFDDPLKVAQAENAPSQFLENIQTPIILDEVQYVKDLFRYIKIYVDQQSDKTHFFLTGSQQFSMMQNVSESLSGRIHILEMNTLSYEEASRENTSLQLYGFILQGGYPGIYKKNILPNEFFPSYVSTYLERDVRNILNIRDLRDFSIFLRLLATYSGQILNMSNLSRDLGKTNSTVKSWISVLIGSGIVRLLEPYYCNHGKRLTKSPKLYFMDTGLLCYLLGITNTDSLLRSPFKGAIWETFCFISLVSYFNHRGIPNPPLWFWRDSTKREVDFLIEENHQVRLFESKFKERVDAHDAQNMVYWKEKIASNQEVLMQIMAPVREAYPVLPEVWADYRFVGS